jgi:hypothetical protein
MDTNPETATKPNASELKAAGYTPVRTTVILCLVAGAIGGALGSIYLAILLNALLGPESESLNRVVGAAFGAFAAAGILFAKIRQGNLEAHEKIQDAEWRKLLLHLHRRPGLEVRGNRPGGP